MSDSGKGVVIPFHLAKAGLWAAHREWMRTGSPLQRLADRLVEILDRAERDLKKIEAALEEPHPAPLRLGSFVRGELSREDNRAVVRHLLTGCADCAAVLRPLLEHPDPRSL